MRRGPLVAAAAALNLAVVSLSLLLFSLSLDIRVSRAAAAASGNAADDADRQRRGDGSAEGPGGDYDPRGLQTWTDGEVETLSRRGFPFAFSKDGAKPSSISLTSNENRLAAPEGAVGRTSRPRRGPSPGLVPRGARGGRGEASDGADRHSRGEFARPSSSAPSPGCAKAHSGRGRDLPSPSDFRMTQIENYRFSSFSSPPSASRNTTTRPAGTSRRTSAASPSR